MITSIIHINTERGKVNSVAEQLAGLVGVSEVFSISGDFDIIAIIRVAHADDLSDFVTNQIVKIDGITKTDTSLAFKAYSKHDLESMFTL